MARLLMVIPFSGPTRTGPESCKMCLSPTFLWMQRGPKWEKQAVPCRKCKRCLDFRVADYVGRSLCEASTSAATVSVTLTYRPRDDFKDVVLHPPHFQAFVRALRRRGHYLRYLAAGEYGELKGRAHFHAILFFKPSPAGIPQMPQKERFWPEEWWPHGHVFADWSADQRAIRYVCKYLLKAERGESWFSLSKKPPLGWDFFAARADEQIALGLAPVSFEYRPPNAGSKARFHMVGAVRRDYLLRVADGLAGTGKMVPERLNEWVTRSLDKAFRWEERREILRNLDPAAMLESVRDSADAGRQSEEKIRRRIDNEDAFAAYERQQVAEWEFQTWLAREERRTLPPHPFPWGAGGHKPDPK